MAKMTDEEAAAARIALAEYDREKVATVRAKEMQEFAPILEMANSQCFIDLAAMIETARTASIDFPIFAHVNALSVGISGIRTFAARYDDA